MNPDAIRQQCDEIDRATAAIRAELDTAPAPPSTVLVSESDELIVALETGGAIVLAAGVPFVAGGGFAITAPDTTIAGLGGNSLEATTAPAIRVVPGVPGAALECLAGKTASDGGVIQIGRNDHEQTTIEAAPLGVTIRAVTSTGHRGKRAIEVNGRDVAILDCDVHDCFDPAGRDSQAIWIGNCPGPVAITGGYFEGASENLMIGGDSMKIPDCRPTNITITGATFEKPIAWKTEGGPKVKNLLECKDGHDVVIEDCDLVRCWKSGQDGYAFMFTPANGGSLRNVVVRNCRVREVGGIVNVTGTDAAGINPERTQVTIDGGEYRTNKTAMGGSGRFLLAQRGPEALIVRDAYIAHEGNALMDLADDDAPIDVLEITGSTWNYGSYGIRIGGASHGDNAMGLIGLIVIAGNTISGAHSAFRERYPENAYIAGMSRDREREVDRTAKDYARSVRDELARVLAWEREYRL
jgi:hypothetical protein